MNIEDIKPGDLIAIKTGRFNGVHVGIITPVYGNMVIYEYTTKPRGTCVRTGRTEPVGIQAHFLQDFLDSAAKVSCLPLCRPLYSHEEDRLLIAAELCLGHGQSSWGGVVNDDSHNAAMFVAHVYRQVGVMQKSRSAWLPSSLISHLTKMGIVGKSLSLN